MAIRRFKQIGSSQGSTGITRPRFRRPSKPIKHGDTVELEYADGRVDTVVVLGTHITSCNGCKYVGVGTSCPCYMDQAGFMCCIFGGTSHAVDVDAVLEEI